MVCPYRIGSVVELIQCDVHFANNLASNKAAIPHIETQTRQDTVAKNLPVTRCKILYWDKYWGTWVILNVSVIQCEQTCQRTRVADLRIRAVPCFIHTSAVQLHHTMITGPRCTYDVDDCWKNQCRNGGICVDQRLHSICICKPLILSIISTWCILPISY